jgi:ribosomal protein L7/L12
MEKFYVVLISTHTGQRLLSTTDQGTSLYSNVRDAQSAAEPALALEGGMAYVLEAVASLNVSKPKFDWIEVDPESTHIVTITGYKDDCKISMIKAIYRLTSMSLKEAKEASEALPFTLPDRYKTSQLSDVKRVLDEERAIYSITAA